MVSSPAGAVAETSLSGGKHPCLHGGDHVRLAEWMVVDGLLVSVVNPFVIEAYGMAQMSRKKTDRAVAGLIARFCAEQRPQT
jgi:transposase